MGFREIIETTLFILAILSAHFGSLLWFHHDLKSRIAEKTEAMSKKVSELSESMQVISAQMSDVLFLMAGSHDELEEIEKALNAYHGKLKPIGARLQRQREAASGSVEPRFDSIASADV